MKEVFIDPTPKSYIFKSLDHLVARHNYIGFEMDDQRYFIVRSGPAMNLAVNPDGTYDIKENQEDIHVGYFIFESAKELYDWMVEYD